MEKILRKLLILAVAVSIGMGAAAPALATEELFVGFSLAPMVYSAEEVVEGLKGAIHRGESAYMVRLGHVNLMDIARDYLQQRGMSYRYSSSTYEDGTTDLVVEMEIAIGQKVAYADRNKKTSTLNDREREVYTAARRILNRIIRPGMDELARETAIHDYLIENVEYELYGDGGDAYGALIRGKARCSGYADAFYLLSTLSALNVMKMPGMAGGDSHEWNLVELDGQWYFVDVTWNASAVGGPVHTYFNQTANTFSRTHAWIGANVPGTLAIAIDKNNYFIANDLVATSTEKLIKIALTQYTPGKNIEVLLPASFNVESVMRQVLAHLVAHTQSRGGRIAYSTTQMGNWQHLVMQFTSGTA